MEVPTDNIGVSEAGRSPAHFTGVARRFPAYREVGKYYSSAYPSPKGVRLNLLAVSCFLRGLKTHGFHTPEDF